MLVGSGLFPLPPESGVYDFTHPSVGTDPLGEPVLRDSLTQASGLSDIKELTLGIIDPIDSGSAWYACYETVSKLFVEFVPSHVLGERGDCRQLSSSAWNISEGLSS